MAIYGYTPFDRYVTTGFALAACIFLGIIAAIVIFIVFMPAKNESRYNGFLLWAHRALNFRTMFSLSLLKFLYLLTVCSITLYGLYMLFVSFLSGIVIIIIGNLVTRISYELLIIIFSIHDNVSRINTNTSFMRGASQNTQPAGSVQVSDGPQQYIQPQPNQQKQSEQQKSDSLPQDGIPGKENGEGQQDSDNNQ